MLLRMPVPSTVVSQREAMASAGRGTRKRTFDRKLQNTRRRVQRMPFWPPPSSRIWLHPHPRCPSCSLCARVLWRRWGARVSGFRPCTPHRTATTVPPQVSRSSSFQCCCRCPRIRARASSGGSAQNTSDARRNPGHWCTHFRRCRRALMSSRNGPCSLSPAQLPRLASQTRSCRGLMLLRGRPH